MAMIPLVDPHPDLAAVAENGLSPLRSIPWEGLLEHSVYYPASGLDADTVRLLSGSIKSFIYCSFGYTRQQFEEELRKVGFKGYRMTFERWISRSDIVPASWFPPIKPNALDGNLSILRTEESRGDLFGHWSIWKSSSDQRWFSFIFISGEACAVFQGLYMNRGCRPMCFASFSRERLSVVIG